MSALERVRKHDRVRIVIETNVEDIHWYDGGEYAGREDLAGRADVVFSNRHTLEVPPTAVREESGTTITVEVLS